MGDFRIVVEAVGGHGCQRDVKDGGTVKANCGQESCPDCAARAFVEEFKKHNSVSSATLTHWPTSDLPNRRRTPPTGENIVDDLLSLKRSGSF